MKSFFFASFLPSICASSESTIDISEFYRSTSGPPLQKNQAFKSDNLALSDFVKITSWAHTEHFLSHGSQTRIKTKAKTTTRHRKRQKTKTSFPRFTDSPEPGGKGRGKRGRSSMAAPSEVSIKIIEKNEDDNDYMMATPSEVLNLIID